MLQGAWFLGTLAWASILDCQKRVVPNTICLLTAAAGLVSFHPARLFGIFAALPLLIAALLQPDGMGGGDIKLTAAAGSVLGLGPGLWGLALALLLMVLFSSSVALIQKLSHHTGPSITRTPMPLVPFLSLGFAALYCLTVGGMS